MAADPAKGALASREVLADRVSADCPRIVCRFELALEAIGSPIVRDDVARRQAVLNAERVLADVVASVHAGDVLVNVDNKQPACATGESRAAHGVYPQESLRAASALFEVTLPALAEHLATQADWSELFAVAVLALNQSLTMRIRHTASSYTGYLLDKVREAQVGERRRIARELHDRVGGGLSSAHRQLELYDLHHSTEPLKAANRVAVAQQAIVEATQNLREVTRELRSDPSVTSLETALASYLETISAKGATAQLRVNGDETWLSRTICGETCLILREAVRNALAHGNATAVLVNVEISAHELRARVEDNGQGFDLASAHASGGVGLSSMHERAAVLGGTVAVTAKAGRGTQVELLIPLPGDSYEPAR